MHLFEGEIDFWGGLVCVCDVIWGEEKKGGYGTFEGLVMEAFSRLRLLREG